MLPRDFAGGIETLRNIRELLTDTKGGVAVIFGILLPSLLGISALAIEVGSWYADKNRLQIAADAAAYSALVAYQKNKSLTDAVTIGVANARASGYSGPADTIKILIPSPDGTLGPNSSRAVLTEPSPLFLSQLFLKQGWLDISTVSYATASPATPNAPCMLALKPNQSRSIVFASSVKVDMACVVSSNSNASDAIWAEGQSSLKAHCATVPGTVATNGGAKVTFSNCPNGSYQRTSSEDYLASTPFWGSANIPDTNVFVDANVAQSAYGEGLTAGNQLKPGKYSKQVDIIGTVHLAPGIYYFTNGLRAAPNSKIIGEGVTIFIDQSKLMDFSENVQWQLSAPTSGPTKGIVLTGRPDIYGGSVRLFGIIGNVQGAVYFPNQEIKTASGPNLPKARCTQIVASFIDVRGEGTITNDCSGVGNQTGSAGGKVQLAKGPSV